ncbi:hypothetical protein ACQ4PT_011036 [Festuca glaucescens]
MHVFLVVIDVISEFIFKMIPLTSLKKSKTPKSKKKNSYSKFRKMKQRLQYKSVPKEVLNEKPLRSVPPLEGVMPFASEAPPRDDGDEGDNINVNNDADKKEDAEKKEKANLFNRSSPMKVVRVSKSMTNDQRSLIIGANFGGVLGMKCSKLIPELCRFLMECFDQEECVLDFGERGKIPITLDLVVRVMDVPMGSHPVPYQANIEATNLVFQMLGIHDGKQPTVTSLEKQLGKEYPADDDYLRKFIIYVMSSVFAPTTGIQVSPKCYPAVINTKAIASLNWAGFIIGTLIQTANAKGNKNWFKACMPYLMLKPWFRNKPSIFCYQPSVVDMFIKHHLKVNVDEKMLGQYRTAVINMCTSFEDGVAEFITSLGNSKGHNYSVNHDEEKGKHNRNKRKSRKVPHVQQPIDEVGNQKVDDAEELKGKKSDEVNVDAGLKLPKANKRKTTDTNLVGVVATKKKVKVTSNLVGVVATKKISGQDVSKTSVQDDQPDANSEDNVVEDKKQTQQIDCDVTLNAEVSDVNEQKHEVSDCAPNILSPGKLHALNHLQLYGSGSQSSTDTPPAHSVEVNEGITILAQIPNQQISKKVTQGSPFGRRPVTRSMSPLKATAATSTITSATPSPRRLTRMVAAAIKASQNKDDNVLHCAAPNESHSVTPSEMIDSSMNRKLELDFASAEPVAETEMQRKIRELRDDCPSFDLGLDCPDSQQTETKGQVHQPDATIEEPIIISSNEDNGDSLDKIYATIEMPNTTPATVKGKVIMFSILQDLTPEIKDVMTGHYYLIVLNLKSGSSTTMSPRLTSPDIRLSTFKPQNKIQRYDCGYFVLKFIESWDGKRMLQIKASDMPAFRKLFLKKWMDPQENLINWDELLFNN